MNLKIIVLTALFFCGFLLNSGCERPSEYNQEDDGLPPAVPAGLYLYFARDGEVLFEWRSNNEADLKGYNVYKTNDSQYIKIAFTPDNYFLDDSLDYDSTYFYRVSAVDIWERESSLSLEINAKPENKYPPAAPRFVTINARNWESNLSVFLFWEPNSETDIAGYNIYRNTYNLFNPDSSSFIGYSDTESWSDTSDLSLLTDYYYRIRAVDKGGLIGSESFEVNDRIYKMPEIVFPKDNEEMNFYGDFKFTAAGSPASYKIIVQSNIIIGTLWEKEFSSNLADDTLEIKFDYPYVEQSKEYYWRIASYSGSPEPNSITKLYKFKIR